MGDLRILSIWVVMMSCWLYISCRQIPKIGPYTLNLRERANCYEQDNGQFVLNGYKANKINRTTWAISGSIISNITIDDSYEIHLNNAVWGNGGFKRNGLTYNHGPVCTVAKTLYSSWWRDILPQVEAQLNVTDCPIPGPFTLNISSTLNSQRFLQASDYIPQLPYGRYLAEMMVVKDGIIYGCIAGIIELVPRKLPRKPKS